MKTTRLKQVFVCALIAFSSVAFAQKGQSQKPAPPRDEKARQDRKEDIEAMKVAFITKKLDLTPEEAQLFWPVYNQYSDKLNELRKKRREDHKQVKQNFDTMSDKEVETVVDNEMVMRQKELDIQKEYHAKFKAVLPIKKVARLYTTEEQFKRVLLDKLKDREREKPAAPKEKE